MSARSGSTPRAKGQLHCVEGLGGYAKQVQSVLGVAQDFGVIGAAYGSFFIVVEMGSPG